MYQILSSDFSLLDLHLRDLKNKTESINPSVSTEEIKALPVRLKVKKQALM